MTQASSVAHANGRAARGLQELWGVAVAFALSASTVTGLLYYFGWVRYSTMLSAFGTPVRTMGYSPTDYVMASVDSLFKPIAIGVPAVFAIFLIERRWSIFTNRITIGILTSAALFGLLNLRGVLVYFSAPWQPIVFVLAGTMIARVIWDSGSNTTRRIAVGFAVCLALTMAFWWVALYARYGAEESTLSIQRNINTLSAVSIISQSPLGLPGENRTDDSNGTTYTASHYLVVAHSTTHVLLVRDSWNPGSPAYLVDINQNHATLAFSRATS